MARFEVIVALLAGLIFVTSTSADDIASEKKQGNSSGQNDPFTRASPDSMSLGEREQAKALDDGSQALWKVHLAPRERRRSLLERPSAFGVTNSHIATPFGNYLLLRNIADGHFNWFYPPRFNGPTEQVYGDQTSLIFTLAPGDPPGPADVLVIGDVSQGVRQGKPYVTCTLAGHEENPWRVLMSPFGGHVVSCSDDGSICLWEIQRGNGREVAKFEASRRDANGQPVRGEFVAYSPYGKWLATVRENTVSLRRPHDGKELISWRPNLPVSHRITALRFSTDGFSLLLFLGDVAEPTKGSRTFLRFDLETRQESTYDGVVPAVDGRALADGNQIITWNGSPRVSWWNLQRQEEVGSIDATKQYLYDVAFAPSGDTMATAGDDDEIKFWSISDRTRIETDHPFAHEGIDTIQFSADGKYLVSFSVDGWLRVWQTPKFCWSNASPAKRAEIDGNTGIVREIFEDGTIKVRQVDGTVTEFRADGTVKTYKQQ